jgi:hypothetical protein
VSQIERVLEKRVAGDTVCAPLGVVGDARLDVVVYLDRPQADLGGVVNPDVLGLLAAEQFKAEHRDVVGGDPCGTEPGVDFRGLEIHRLDAAQGIGIGEKARILRRRFHRNAEFLSDVARKIVVVGLPTLGFWIKEQRSLQLGKKVVRFFPEQLPDVREVHLPLVR